MPDGNISLENSSESLHLSSNLIEAKDSSGLDYPEETLNIRFSGNESSDLLRMSHESPPMDVIYGTKFDRPNVEVLRDVRLRGALCF